MKVLGRIFLNSRKETDPLGFSMTFEVILIEIKYLGIHNISVHINFHRNRIINESVRKNFLKFSNRRKDERT